MSLSELGSRQYMPQRCPREEVARLKGLKLVPGMPVEAFLQTLDRTVLSYLVKPLEDQMMKAFRER
jgi:HlyD family secretion protein